MKRKIAFFFISILLLMPWPAAYAYDQNDAGVGSVSVAAADPSASPVLNAFGNAVGSVTPGDLFIIDSLNNPADASVTLNITNVDELVRQYRYMTLDIGTYVQDSEGAWEEVASGADHSSLEQYLTMLNGAVSFILAGSSRYRITVDGGCFYCYRPRGDDMNISPRFYLTLN